MNPRRVGDDERCAVVPLAAGRGHSTWLAAGALLLGAALVGAGVFGRILAPSSPASSAAPGPGGTTTAPTAEATISPAPGRASGRTVLPHSGYELDVDASHPVMVFEDGGVATFSYGPLASDGSYRGEIRVAVGTPARGAAVVSRSGVAYVFGTTLKELAAAYTATASGRPLAQGAGELDGIATTTLRIDYGPSGVAFVVLAVHGNRAFVLTSAGFEGLYPAGPNSAGVDPAEAGMEAFSAGFHFGRSLFVSRELGFQVPLPVQAVPFGTALALPLSQANGLYVFPDGSPRGETWTHSIGVSVGTKANQALVTVLPGGSPRPDPYRIWAPGLVDLQATYLAAIGGRVGSSATMSLGGELALLIEEPDGLGAAVLAVHHGRDYIISATGSTAAEPGPGFEEFLAGFAFLD